MNSQQWNVAQVEAEQRTRKIVEYWQKQMTPPMNGVQNAQTQPIQNNGLGGNSAGSSNIPAGNVLQRNPQP